MTGPSWIEISLIVDGELAESVAEVLARYLPNGVVIESTAVDTTDPETAGRAVGPMRVCGYIPIDRQMEATRQKVEQALWYLGRIRPLPAPEFKPIYEIEWVEAWKEHYQPVSVGEKLMIVPAWLSPETAGRIPILIDPGMAFGTGTHPTTQLCLELIEAIQGSVQHPHETEVIDVGCGSGILSIAALKLGARQALGVDTDPDAVGAALENARLNQLSAGVEFSVGSLAEIIAGEFSLTMGSLVLTNILAPVILRLLDLGLRDLLLPDGCLVLSGILEDQLPEIEAALSKNGLRLFEQRMIEDWVALLAEPI
jgi:ribosomal protein L11 methyltransferase